MRFKIPRQQPAGFRPSALYLAGQTANTSPDRVAWVKAYGLETTNPEAAAAVMQATAARSTRCRTPAYHFVLAFDPKDARAGKAGQDTLREIADEAFDRLELKGHQALVFSHRDTDHPHLHFLVNRVHPETGKAYSRHNDGRRLTGLVQEIARERGLNVARDRTRIAEKELVKELDVPPAEAPAPKDKKPRNDRRNKDRARDHEPHTESQPYPQTVSEGEYWQAMREDRPPQPALGKDAVRHLRDRVQSHFHNAESWEDLTTRLAAHGVALERKGQGLILSREDGTAKLSAMGKGVRLKELEARFGEGFADYTLRRANDLKKAVEHPAELPDRESMTPAERRRAERLADARQAVKRKRRDPVLELDEADRDVAYWQGVQALQRNSVFQLRRAEREHAWQTRMLDRRRGNEGANETKYWEAMGKVYRMPKRASRIWDRFDKRTDPGVVDQQVAKEPSFLGAMRGAAASMIASDKRKEAMKYGKFLVHRRKKWRQAKEKLEQTRAELEEASHTLKQAMKEYDALHNGFETPQQVERILRDKLIRRAAALRRVTDRAIVDSDIAEERKHQLTRAWYAYQLKQRDRERGREWGRGR